MLLVQYSPVDLSNGLLRKKRRINEKRKRTGLHHKTVKAGESEEAYNLLLMGLAFLSRSFCGLQYR